MDSRGKRQTSSLFGGMGFYIALLVCVVAAGVVGYFALQSNTKNTTENPVQDPDPQVTVNQTGPASTLPVVKDEETPVKPVLNPEPVTVDKPVVTDTAPAKTDAAPVSADTPEPVAAPAPDPAPVTAPHTAPDPGNISAVSPLTGETVAVFSVDQLTYDPTLGDWRTHNGMDIKAEAGTPVVATAAGVVASVEEDSRLGVTVTIDHGNGYVTTYASLHPEVPVLAGDTVAAGDVIGAVGNTSLIEAGLGAHLHFSVTKDGELVDPSAYLGTEE